MARNISFRSTFRDAPIHVPSELSVKLTPLEDQLCTLLDECKHDLASKGQDVECRIAGGWVRDKLLGADSHDIDIALANMMGVAFAERFVSYVSSKDLPVKSVTTIARNPEQSKHLETARTTILGIELDFVNLRSEEYAVDSRIPTEIKLGTPLEDALRRDVTMNALFYNVHTRSVEDFTNKGLDDLRNKTLRTPLPPKETFMDDPLRVIRCVRFASRYGFRMVPELEAAARNKEIQAAIVSKISRERIGEEIDKMMKGRDPLHSIRLIHDLGLQEPLFAVSQSTFPFSQPPAPQWTTYAASTILHALLSIPSTLGLPSLHPLFLSQISFDKTLKPRLYLAAALTPYRHLTCTVGKKQISAAEIIIREALKLGLQNHYVDGIPALFAAADVLKGPVLEKFSGKNKRSKIGLVLKTKTVHNANSGSHWSSSLLFSLVQELYPHWNWEKDDFDTESASKIVETYNNFLAEVEVLGLPKSIDEKPLLNGRDIVSILSAPKPGAWTGDVLAKVTEWQLDHPEGTKDVCAAWLKEQHTLGLIQVGDPAKGKVGKKDETDEAPSASPSKRIKTK